MTTTQTIDITNDQIESLMYESGEAGDGLQIACCAIALDMGGEARAKRAVTAAEWARAVALWPEAATARAECARVITDAQAQQEPTRYRVREEGGAETTITAHSFDEALALAREWVESGTYEQPGSVQAWVTEIGPDGDGLAGTTRTITVQVGR